MVAQGAGAAGRISVGTTVFGGMLAATSLNLLFIPMLYVVVRTLVPRKKLVSLAAGEQAKA
jgi:HAE1 family hydrophobic/amphiphilic exporter-1